MTDQMRRNAFRPGEQKLVGSFWFLEVRERQVSGFCAKPDLNIPLADRP
jgi:hypothetical protein